jgi:hypothetical protein
MEEGIVAVLEDGQEAEACELERAALLRGQLGGMEP